MLFKMRGIRRVLPFTFSAVLEGSQTNVPYPSFVVIVSHEWLRWFHNVVIVAILISGFLLGFLRELVVLPCLGDGFRMSDKHVLDRLLRGFEAKVAQKKRGRGRLLLGAEDFLDGLGFTRAWDKFVCYGSCVGFSWSASKVVTLGKTE